MAPHADQDMQVAGITDTTSVVIPDPVLTKAPVRHTLANASDAAPTSLSSSTSSRFTIADVLSHRQQSAPISPGVAAFASADLFKSRYNATKPKSRRWDHRISAESARRKPSSLKAAMKYFNKDVISLCGGLPSSEYFPFEQISFQVPTAPQFSVMDAGSALETAHLSTLSAGKHDVPKGESAYDLSIALNYGQSMGPPQLMRFVTEHTEIVHNPPYADWDICVTVGSTSALDMALRIFCEPGDSLLTEEYSFSSAIETALPMGLRPVGIKMDADGLVPEHLDAVLSTWDEAMQGKKPCVLYTIPTGHNPTAATQPASRRKAIYAVADRHDVIILEDEPYYFLQMEDYVSGKIHEVAKPFAPAPSSTLLENLIPSYLSLDTSGRVVRLDSFSKIVAPGSRTGWVTASTQIVERFVRHQEVSSQLPSGFALMALYKLLDESWGHEGFLAWLGFIRAEYSRRRDIMVAACEEHLPREVCSWVPPKAGMFYWIRVDGRKHPQIAAMSAAGTVSATFLEETEHRIFLAGVKENVLLARGSWFRVENQMSSNMQSQTQKSAESDDLTLYFRMTFATVGEERMREAVRRFGVALKREFNVV